MVLSWVFYFQAGVGADNLVRRGIICFFIYLKKDCTKVRQN